MNAELIVEKIRSLVSSDSQILRLGPKILVSEIRLKPEKKTEVCQELNGLFKQLDLANYQIVMAVLEDDDNRYVNIISEGIKNKEVHIKD